MVRIKFFTQDMADSTVLNTNELFFIEVDSAVAMLIDREYVRLKRTLPNARIFCLIENMEDK
jgi:hypothetical protein